MPGAAESSGSYSPARPGPGARVGDHIDLGVLTGELPSSLIDDVLAETGRREKRHRKLPARAAVYFVLAMCLFSGSDSLCPPGYRSVMGGLPAGLRDLCRRCGYATPTSSALTQARQRLGSAPPKALFDRVRGPIASGTEPWAQAFGLRVVAWHGTVVEVPDSSANAARFGHHGHRKDDHLGDPRAQAAAAVARSGRKAGAGLGSNPLVRMLMLVECGTHAVIDVVFDAAASVMAVIRRSCWAAVTCGKHPRFDAADPPVVAAVRRLALRRIMVLPRQSRSNGIWGSNRPIAPPSAIRCQETPSQHPDRQK